MSDKKMSDLEYYSKLYELTTERLMEMQPLKLMLDKGRAIRLERYLFDSTWKVNKQLQQYAYTMMKGLQ